MLPRRQAWRQGTTHFRRKRSRGSLPEDWLTTRPDRTSRAGTKEEPTEETSAGSLGIEKSGFPSASTSGFLARPERIEDFFTVFAVLHGAVFTVARLIEGYFLAV